MNSIIWKGVPSTTIQGLLICELPPITKPPLKVYETMIDGRDGTIIEEVGYTAYEKTITIGLRGKYDINKIIKYFSGEGEIIFSNEPDKMYTAKVIAQIDYNRLVRFMTAVVHFKVQPYKHKYNEAFAEVQTATASGTSIVVNDSADANLSSFSIYGKSTQNGTPTPSAPVDIVSLGADGDVSVKINGSNLVKQKTIIQGSMQYGSILFIEADLKPNTQYTFSFKGAVGNKYYFNEFLFTYKSVTVKEGTTVATVTTASNIDKVSDKYVSGKGWLIFKNDIVQPHEHVFDELMLNLGGVALPYQPYTEQTVAFASTLKGIPVTDKNLATYTDANGQMWCADEIDLERGVYVQRINKKTIAEETVITKHEYSNDNFFVAIVRESAKNASTDCMSTHFGKVTNGELLRTTSCVYCMSNMINAIHISVPTTIANDVATFKNWAISNNVVVYHILSTPIETALTEEQIAICKALKSNEPSTTIQNDENAFMKVVYIKPFEVFNEGLESSKPLMVIKGTGKVEIFVNGTGIFTYTFPEGENEVVIDSEKEDAYLGSALKNRNMNGEFPILMPKTNRIDWSGDVESIEILPRSRWL